MSILLVVCLSWGGSIAFILLAGIDSMILFAFVMAAIFFAGILTDSISTLLGARIVGLKIFYKIEENSLVIEKVKQFGLAKGLVTSEFDFVRIIGYLLWFAIFVSMNWVFVYVYDSYPVTLNNAIRISLLPFAAIGFSKVIVTMGNITLICLYSLASQDIRNKVFGDE